MPLGTEMVPVVLVMVVLAVLGDADPAPHMALTVVNAAEGMAEAINCDRNNGRWGDFRNQLKERQHLKIDYIRDKNVERQMIAPNELSFAEGSLPHDD